MKHFVINLWIMLLGWLSGICTRFLQHTRSQFQYYSGKPLLANRQMASSILVLLLTFISIISCLSRTTLPAITTTSSLTSEIPNDLEYRLFSGTYNRTQDSKLFDFLNSASGNIHLMVYPSFFGLQQVIVMGLFDPIYHDLNTAFIQLEFKNNNQSMDWNITDQNIDVQTLYHQQTRQISQCKVNLTFTIRQKDDPSKPKYENTEIAIQMVSENNSDPLCRISFTASLTFLSKASQIMSYSIFVSSVLFLEILLNMYLMRQISLGNINLNKLSLSTVTFCTAQDLYYVLRFVILLMNQPSSARFFYFGPVALMLVQLILFDIRLAVLMWRLRSTGPAPRNTLLSLYIIFYLGILVYVTVMVLFPVQLPLVMLQSLCLMPQIIRNFKGPGNPGFYYSYIIGFLTMHRYIFPVYEHGCPQNLFRYHPDNGFVIGWSILYLVQILFLWLQYWKGARFFIPKRCLPGYYEYNHKYVVDFDDVRDCPICLLPLYLDPQTSVETNELNSTTTNSQSLLVENYVARAPCKHMYHWNCFRSWVEIKLECPVCRTKLPTLVD